MDDGVEPDEVGDVDVAHILANVRNVDDAAALRKGAALVKIAVEADDLVTRLQDHRNHDGSDIAEMTCHHHTHDFRPLVAAGFKGRALLDGVAIASRHREASLQHELACMEGFGETIRRPALAAAQARETGEHLGVEPVLRPLRAEMLEQQLDLALDHGARRHGT